MNLRIIKRKSDQLKRTVSRLLGHTIIQFGPPRSGSTLVYNLLKEIFPAKYIEKNHHYDEKSARFPTVVTYRHPLDSIASSLQRYRQKPTDELIEKQIKEFAAFGIWRVQEIMGNPQVLLLRYESFVASFDVIFDGIEHHFGINVSTGLRARLDAQYDMATIAKKTSSMASFAEVEPKTHWHGDHISSFKGQPGYYDEFFSRKQIQYLKEVYADYMQVFSYD